jgi:hypothetical protein
MSDQHDLFESPLATRAAAMAEAHRRGEFFIEPDVVLPPTQASVPARHRARTDDPRSSKLAAEDVTESGRADAEAAQVLAALRHHPGTTSKELAEYSGLDYHLCARRLPELRDKHHLVEHGASRLCRFGSQRREVLTWLPINPYHPNGGSQQAEEATPRLRPPTPQPEPAERTAP